MLNYTFNVKDGQYTPAAANPAVVLYKRQNWGVDNYADTNLGITDYAHCTNYTDYTNSYSQLIITCPGHAEPFITPFTDYTDCNLLITTVPIPDLQYHAALRIQNAGLAAEPWARTGIKSEPLVGLIAGKPAAG
jgi:hypothetical protein